MTLALPTDLTLSVVRVSASTSLYVDQDILKPLESWSLVLRASNNSRIVLSSGQRLAEVDIHLTLSTKWRNAQELDRELTSREVGFLAHIVGEQGEPLIHGCALPLNATILTSLINPGMEGKVNLVLPTVPFEDNNDKKYIWGTNRLNMLRISQIEVSVFCGKGVDNDG